VTSTVWPGFTLPNRFNPWTTVPVAQVAAAAASDETPSGILTSAFTRVRMCDAYAPS